MASDEQPTEADALLTNNAANRRTGWLRVLGRLVISVGVLGWLISRTNWHPLAETLREVRLDLCFWSFVTYCVSQVISSVRWQLLGRAVGLHESLGRYVALYFVGMFFNLFLPTSMGGDLARAWYLAGGKGKRLAAALSVFSERLTGLIALLMLASVATIPNWGILPDWTLWLTYLATASAFVGLAALPFLGRWSSKARKLAEALSIRRGQRGRWLAALGLSFLVQGLSVVMLALLGEALGLPIPWRAYAVVMPLAGLFTMILPTLNGVGVREGSLVLLLAPAGVSEAQAIALGLLWFGVLVSASVLGGGVFLLGGFRQVGKDTHGPERGDTDQGRAGKPAAAA